MTIQNDFLTFAGGTGANVITQAVYAALAAQQTGFQAGVAPSAQLNKVWRQSSIAAAVLAQFICDRSGQAAVDDGTTATLLANLKLSTAALNGDPAQTFSVAPATTATQAVRMGQIQTQAGTAFATGGSAPNFTLTPSPAITALAAGQRFRVNFSAAGTSGNTLNVNGTGAVLLMQFGGNGSLIAANIPSGLLSDVEYNGTYWVLLDPVTPGALLNVRTFTSSTTYTPTPGTNSIEVEGGGGGGAGGGVPIASGSVSAVGGGGSAGTWGRKRITSGFSGVAITIGAGGTGSANAAGGNGGTTSFGSLLTLPGGGGGAVGTVVSSASMNAMGGPSSNPATGADVSSQGAVGLSGVVLAATVAYSGQGANSQFGSGGGYAAANSTYVQTGTSAAGYGAGGGGAIGVNSGVTAAGGNGTPGILIIREYS